MRPTFSGGATFCAKVQKFPLTTPNEQTESNRTDITKRLSGKRFSSSRLDAPSNPAAAKYKRTRKSETDFLTKRSVQMPLTIFVTAMQASGAERMRPMLKVE